jgi:Mycolic acid cyclopropane synthetase
LRASLTAPSGSAWLGGTHEGRFELLDYRKLEGKFEIVSVGMFAHVGVQHYPEFLRQSEKPRLRNFLMAEVSASGNLPLRGNILYSNLS